MNWVYAFLSALGELLTLLKTPKERAVTKRFEGKVTRDERQRQRRAKALAREEATRALDRSTD